MVLISNFGMVCSLVISISMVVVISMVDISVICVLIWFINYLYSSCFIV